MSSNNELFQALQYLGQSGKEYGLSLAINQANEQAQALKSSMMDDMERRSALSNLADDIAARMAGAGAQGQHIASVAQAIKPVTASTAEQAVMFGAQTGDKALMKIGQDVQAEEDKRKMNFLEQQARLQEARDYRLAGFQSDLADKKMQAAEKRAEKAPKPLSETATKGLADLQTQASSLAGLMVRIDKHAGKLGPVAGKLKGVSGYLDKDFATFSMELGQYFDGYRKAITGAGAGPTELAMLEKNIPTVNDPAPVLKAKMRRALQIGKQVMGTQIEFYGRSGKDVSGFADLMKETPAGKVAADLTNFLED